MIFDELANKALSDEYFYELLTKAEINAAHQFIYQQFKQTDFNPNCYTALPLNNKEYSDLLRFAEILSKSTLEKAHNKSLKILSVLYDSHSKEKLYKSHAYSILVQLGIFPSLEMIVSEEHQKNLEVSLIKNIKEVYQQTPFDNSIFTDKQYEIFRMLIKNNHFSFSAPTSFGKSFVIKSFIKKLADKEDTGNIVILVPTKALINQVRREIKESIDTNKYVILHYPTVPQIYKNKKYVFVFTPERWISYITDFNNPPVTHMFVDEAHKIVAENDERAPVYYHAISLAERKSINLYFAAPNIPNADIFLKLFEKSTEESLNTIQSPVSQSRYFVDYIDKKLCFYTENNSQKEFVFIDEKPLEMIARTGGGSQNIIYCNTISDTIDYALSFSEMQDSTNNPEIQKAISLVATHIHKEYFLTRCLEKGVAFHFGRLPQVIRETIEDLFIKGYIKYVFCTSTLLEGVNLPAKNIYIFSNAIGMTKFTSIDFWNLAGRAGRLAKELEGNIICVRADDKRNRWKNPEKDLKVVRSKTVDLAEPLILSGRKNFYKNIQNSLENKEFTVKEPTETSRRIWNHYANIAATQKIMNRSSLLLSNFNSKQPDSINILNQIQKQNKVPENILVQNSMISPYYQNNIFSKINSKNDAFPQEVTYDTCLLVLFTLYKEYNWGAEESGGKHPLVKTESVVEYLATLMNKWISGKSLNQIINESLWYYQNKRKDVFFEGELFKFRRENPYHVNHVINDVIRDIDTKIRFRVKIYLQNYYSLLKVKLGEEKAGPNWSDYVEFGTTNTKIIELQNFGFERHIAKLVFDIAYECLEYDTNNTLVGIHEKDLTSLLSNKGYENELEEIKQLLSN